MAQFKIKAVEKKDCVLQLKVWITEPQQQFFYDESNFAIQLLWDAMPVDERDNSALGKEVSMDQILDGEWVLNNEAKFISAVDILETNNYPLSSEYLNLTGKASEEFWNNLDNAPTAKYNIMVTEAKWIEHIKKGSKWTSSAINYEL